jgi:hypothetical protein
MDSTPPPRPAWVIWLGVSALAIIGAVLATHLLSGVGPGMHG